MDVEFEDFICNDCWNWREKKNEAECLGIPKQEMLGKIVVIGICKECLPKKNWEALHVTLYYEKEFNSFRDTLNIEKIMDV